LLFASPYAPGRHERLDTASGIQVHTSSPDHALAPIPGVVNERQPVPPRTFFWDTWLRRC